MCPRCYEESTDVKILSINLAFLKQATNGFQGMDMKIPDLINGFNGRLEENDEFFGFTQEEIDQSTKNSDAVKKILDTEVKSFEKYCERNDSNNNIDGGRFFGFSSEEIDNSKEDYKKFDGINKMVRYEMQRAINLNVIKSKRRNSQHRKSVRRKNVSGRNLEKESKYFNNERCQSSYFQRPDNCWKTRIKEEKIDLKLETCEHIKSNPTETEPELIDYESEYFRTLESKEFFIKTEEVKKEDSKTSILEGKPTIWVPPRSPHNLIEEVLYHDPWALLVATIFLNRTSCMCARPHVFWFLTENPDPLKVVERFPQDLEKYFVKLGLQRTRAVQVWRMSHDFMYKSWGNVKELYGIGSYGEDAFRMFCQGNFDVKPRDRFLRIYKAWYEKIQLGQCVAAKEDVCEED